MIGHSPKAEVDGRGDSGEQSIDGVLDLLAHQRRRAALACLFDHSQAIALADLAEDVAVRENEEPIGKIPKAEIQEVRLMLHHQHLPKLVEAGAVEYDQERDLIRIADSADLVERVLALTGDGGDER